MIQNIKEYELKDHLGNVRVAIGDMKIPTTTRGVAPFVVDEKSVNDFYPGGMAISDRSWQSTDYRYGYNGQEKSLEIDASGNHHTAEFWEVNNSSLRRWNRDPVVKPHESGYSIFGNDPINRVDPNGDADYYDNKGILLLNDKVDDKKIFLTERNIIEKNKKTIKDEEEINIKNIQSSDKTKLLGIKNEYGLIQLTKMGHPNIENNDNSEESYSYENGVKKDKYGDDWVKPSTGAAFYGLVDEFIKETKNNNAKFIINDASAYNPLYDLGHKTHFEGLSIDLRFVTSTGKGSNNLKLLNKSDINLNAKLTSIASEFGFVKNYVDGGLFPNTKHAPGHKDHLHLGRKK